MLSVNKTNLRQACDWGCEVVVVPDTPGSLDGLEETLGPLAEHGIPVRIDPILNPISFGFSESLGRYLDVRKRWPDEEMLMGVGNLTELTDVDSAGINVLMLGFCQEVGVRPCSPPRKSTGRGRRSANATSHGGWSTMP